jgi:hypothetical protein
MVNNFTFFPKFPPNHQYKIPSGGSSMIWPTSMPALADKTIEEVAHLLAILDIRQMR